MMQDVRAHKSDYSFLAILAGIFIVYFVQHQNSPHSLVIATIVFGMGYFVWGIWHHKKIESITKHIVLEYFLVALCGIVIVCSLLL